MLLFAFACAPMDYQVDPKSGESSSGEEDSLSAPLAIGDAESLEDPEETADIRDLLGDEAKEISIMFDASLQRNRWGEELQRCQVQVSFSLVSPDPPAGNPQESMEEPIGPGDCSFLQLDELEGGTDNWYVSGELSGPESIHLHGDDLSYELVLTHAQDGRLRYELEDCTEEVFPYGQALALEIPESGSDDLPAFWKDQAMVVGHDMIFYPPSDIGDDGRYHGYSGEDLVIGWDVLGGAIVAGDQEILPYIQVKFNNNMTGEWNSLETMQCEPLSSEGTTISGSDLSQFTVNSFFGEDLYSTGMDVHTVYTGPDFEDPWGRSARSRSIVSVGGMMELVEGGMD
jgi:hypothetical protein